jgi:bifunctional DNA-binding transcriptional regulator/antitoxin component of YhaV-PrlF toxin-antitoxin module
MASQQQIVTVTKKGQATIPKSMRERHKIGMKALVIDAKDGVLVRAIPDPSMERGSLKGLFGKKSSGDIMSEIRNEETKLLDLKNIKTTKKEKK